MAERSEWSAHQIKTLRYQLGWSQADMARRLGCTLQCIMNWEEGADLPEADQSKRLDQLRFTAGHHGRKLGRLPIAEKHMGERSLAQIRDEELDLLSEDEGLPV